MPWGGGNTGNWGGSPWGDGLAGAPVTPPAVFPSAQISSITVMSKNLLRIGFNVAMKIDGILTDPANYSVAPIAAGATVTPGRVLTPSGSSTFYVLLQVTSFTVGERYTVDIANLRTTKGDTVDNGNSSAEFYGRVTKLDFAQGLQPKMYDRSPESIFAKILMAITSEDEKIGGTEGDNE